MKSHGKKKPKPTPDLDLEDDLDNESGATATVEELGPEIQKMISTYEPLTTTPSLLAGVAEFLAKDIPDYHNPTKQQLKFTDQLLDGLIREDATVITDAVTKLGLKCHRFDEDPNLVMFRKGDVSEFPVLLYWRFGEDVEPLILEGPHNKSDLIFRMETDLILNDEFKARCLISNAANKGCADFKAPGQGRRNGADGAHSMPSLFREISTMLFRKMGPGVAHLQIHGMVGSSNTNLLITNQRSNQYTGKYKSICEELAYALAEIYPLEMCNTIVLGTQKLDGQKDGKPYTLNNFEQKKAWFRTKSGCGNSCVSARAINGGGTHDVGSEDRGLFAHLEFRTAKFGLTNKKQERDRFMKVIALAMQNWKNSPKPSPDIKTTTLEEEEAKIMAVLPEDQTSAVIDNAEDENEHEENFDNELEFETVDTEPEQKPNMRKRPRP